MCEVTGHITSSDRVVSHTHHTVGFCFLILKTEEHHTVAITFLQISRLERVDQQVLLLHVQIKIYNSCVYIATIIIIMIKYICACWMHVYSNIVYVCVSAIVAQYSQNIKGSFI
jgi:hypothetical protein